MGMVVQAYFINRTVQFMDMLNFKAMKPSLVVVPLVQDAVL